MLNQTLCKVVQQQFTGGWVSSQFSGVKFLQDVVHQKLFLKQLFFIVIQNGNGTFF